MQNRILLRLRQAILACLVGAAAATATPALSQSVLHRGNGPAPASLDPALGSAITESRITYDLYEGLFTFGPKGELAPAVAESWEISPDGLVYTFKLRQDANWSDGTPVTADDFVFSWRRMVDPATASDYGYFLWPVKNGEAISKGQMPTTALGVEAADAKTLRVTLERPTGYFLNSLQHRATFPVSRANYEKFGRAFVEPGNMVSNGAYMLAEHQPQTFVRVVRNPHYWDRANVKIDQVVFHASDSQDTELRRFRAGELHLVSQIPNAQVEWARRNIPESVRFHQVYVTWYLGFNMTREPWASNPKVREALALAIDRQVLVDKVTMAGEVPNFTLTPPGFAGYRNPVPAMAEMTQEQRDQRARALLAEAGYGSSNPLRIEILHPTMESSRRIVVAIAGMWKQKLGVDAVLNNQEFRVQLQTSGDRTYPGVSFLGWLADFGDAYTFLKLLQSDIGKMNRTGYTDPAYDRMLAEANAMMDPEARMARMAEAESLMLADLPLIPLITGSQRTVVSPKVKGFIENPSGFQLSRYMELTP